MSYINEQGLRTLWGNIKEKFIPYNGNGISKTIPDGEALKFAVSASSVNGAILGVRSNNFYFAGRTYESSSDYSDSFISCSFNGNKSPRMYLVKEHDNQDVTSDDALSLDLSNDTVTICSNSGLTVSAMLSTDGLALNDFNGHTPTIKINGTQIPSTVSINGSGNAVTDVSFSNGQLSFTKGTISGGSGADGNYYPTGVNLSYSSGSLGINITGTGMAAISDSVDIDWSNLNGKPSGLDDGPFLPLSGGEMNYGARLKFSLSEPNDNGDEIGVRINSDSIFVGNFGDGSDYCLTIDREGIQTHEDDATKVFTTDGKTNYLKTIDGESIFGYGDIALSDKYLPLSGGTMTGLLKGSNSGAYFNRSVSSNGSSPWADSFSVRILTASTMESCIELYRSGGMLPSDAQTMRLLPGSIQVKRNRSSAFEEYAEAITSSELEKILI